MTDPAQIAKSLTRAQREVLLAMPIKNAGALPVFDTCMTLFNRDMVVVYRIEENGEVVEKGMDASDLGLAVRAHIMEEEGRG